MLKRIKNFLFPNKYEANRPYEFRRSIFYIFIAFLLVFNSFSVVFFGGAKQVSATAIDVNRLVELANLERLSRGLNALTIDSRLIAAAQAKGEDMFAKQYWAHYGPNGETPWQFIKAAGYNYIYAGENLAKDFTSTDPIHTAWMNSPSHRDNIINANYNDIGMAAIAGVFDGRDTIIVVQMFGSEYIPPEPQPQPEPEPVPQPEPEPQVPSPSLDLTAPDKPLITEPRDGDLIRVSDFLIKGSAENNSEVEVYDGDDRIGTLNSDGGAFVFDYKGAVEGQHILGATAKDSSGNVSDSSEKVTVTVDTIAPVAKEESLNFLSLDDNNSVYKFTINVVGEPESVVAILGDYSTDLQDISEGFWYAEFKPDIDVLESSNRIFTVIATDVAGNESLATLNIPVLNSIQDNLSELPETGDESPSVLSELRERFSSFFSQASFTNKLNVFLGGILLILAVIDVFYLWKKGFKRKGGISTNHIPILILLLIALLFAATGLIL